jgi:hypothetical protein
MKTPPLTTRFLGNPVVALCMCVWFLHALAGWYLLQPSIPESIIAGCLAVCSLSSWRRMRVHQAWLRQWKDTGQAETQTAARISASRRKSALVFLPPVLTLMLLLLAANTARPDELPILRLLLLGCAAWLVMLALMRKFRKHGGGQASSTVKAEAPSIVAWVAGPASSAPSRAFATSNLPDYALNVMGLRRVNH